MPASSSALLEEVAQFVGENIPAFHAAKLQSLRKLKLKEILLRKNPYLFRAKNIQTSEQLVRSLLEASLSSSEETIFGDFLERVAIFTCGKFLGGIKSSAPGIDLEFDREGIRHIVSIKSGPNWGNSSQKKKMIDNFKSAAKTLRTSSSGIHIRAVNGICYGKSRITDMTDYDLVVGQAFWYMISGVPDLYTQLVEPIGAEAKARNDAFEAEFSAVVNLFTKQFSEQFCRSDGKIDWEKLVTFNSGPRP